MSEPRKLTVKEVAENEGMTVDELLDFYAMEAVVPACCEDGCEVEPDGRCPHGHPSVLLEMGII